jgi:alkylhydroperoxidase family enzyme
VTSRIEPIDVAGATGHTRELLDELASRGAEPGPMVRAMANAPALLRGYLDLTRAMKRMRLDRRVTDSDIALARQGAATDPRIAGMVAFGQRVIAAPAEVTDEQVDELRQVGYTDEQIAEVVGLVSLQLLTGAFNLVSGIHPSLTARSAA